jgi:hypothetical protein
VVRKDLKYTFWSEWDYEELFDLTKDPLEQKNLVSSPEYADRLAGLRKRLESMRTEAR